MGDCRFCKKKAGFLKDVHSACLEKANANLNTLRLVAELAVTGSHPLQEAKISIDLFKRGANLGEEETRITLIDAADKASYKLAVEAPVDDETFSRIFELFKEIGYRFGTQEANEHHWYGFIATAMSNVLYRVLHRKAVDYDPTGRMTFNIGRDEDPIFSTGRVVLGEYRDVAQKSFYQSVGIPVGAGLYYRIGASTAPSHTISLVPSDEGEVLFTTRALYFGGQRSIFKIRYDDILRLESFADGVGIFESHGHGKVMIPDYNGMEVGWFFFNLLEALMKAQS